MNKSIRGLQSEVILLIEVSNYFHCIECYFTIRMRSFSLDGKSPLSLTMYSKIIFLLVLNYWVGKRTVKLILDVR